MPEINSPENLQLQEIEELERQLAEKKAAMSIEGGTQKIESRAETVQENFPELQPQTVAAAVKSTTKTDDEEKRKNIEQDTRTIASMDESRKMETLVALALEKGINHSIEVANNLQDPYILDQLHDKLIGELHDRLVQEKKLKEI